ncbi:HNH endonuclease [Arthrobacter sp. Z1-15]
MLEAAERVRLIDEIRALEDLKNVITAAQARAAAAFDASTRTAQAAAGLKADQLGKGVAAQIALARRESPHNGAKLLGLARILTTEMPHTLHALALGVISEWRATILVRETACLSLADRQRVDELVAGNPGELEQLGDRQLIARIKSLSYGLDPHAVVKRAAHAVSERFVSCRPAPDTMTWVTALLPVSQGVGVYAALTREADRLRATGDPRSKGQIMADTFVERTTGQARAEDVRVEVQLIMTDQALLHGILPPEDGILPQEDKAPRKQERHQGQPESDPGSFQGERPRRSRAPWQNLGPEQGSRRNQSHSQNRGRNQSQRQDQSGESLEAAGSFVPAGAEPAILAGYGIVPAQWARDLIRGPDPAEAEPDHPDRSPDSTGSTGSTGACWGTPPSRPDPRTEVWLRRLYVTPDTGQLTAMDSRARLVPRGLARLIAARDQVCRTPWCGAPIRHYDHVQPVREGGPTSAENIQGLCQACNQAKEAPGWEARTSKPVAADEASGKIQPMPTRHGVTTRTPTGHVYRSMAPPLPAFHQ